MQLAEAKSYIGKVCAIRYLDRSGAEHEITSLIYDATYVPMYGGYFVTDMDDIRLDRAVSIRVAGERSEVAALLPTCAAA